MAPIAPETVFTKTAKGILEIRNKTVKLSRELGLVFLSIDGKATVGELLPRSGMTGPQLQNALNTLATDGYIKAVAQSSQPAVSSSSDELDFTSPEGMTKLNVEAASRALAAADASKRAQAEARAALDARLRQESEARARALAEARAEAEAEARQKAEEAARAAAEERARAEAEAEHATDANTRAQAEARARAAAAAVVRAQAEARVRAEAEARATTLAESKRAAEDEARDEALARTRSEEQAHARAAAEVRASEALEAQVRAMEGARAHSDNPQAQEAEAARARVRELEAAAERAREAARISAEAEGRADEVPQPELDIADRVRQLNARVQAARVSREEAARRDNQSVDYALDGSASPQGKAWPSLELGPGTTATAKAPVPIAPSEMVDLSVLTSTPAATSAGSTSSAEAPEARAESIPAALPVMNLERAEATSEASEHVPGPLERAMAQMAARSQAPQVTTDAPAPAEPAAETQSQPQPGAGEKAVPTIDDQEPLKERLNIDRAAHDLIAESAAAARKTEVARVGRDALSARQKRVHEDAERASAHDRAQRRRKALIGVAAALVIVPALAVAWLQFMPLNGYIPDAQRALAQRLNQPVSIATLRYVLLPTPRLVLEDVVIGATQGVRAERVAAHVWPLAALSGATSFDLVEAENVEIAPDVLGTIPAWTGGRTAGAIQADRLLLKAIKLKLDGAELEPLNGDIAFAPNGTVRSAVFENPKVKLELTPQPEGVRVALNAIGWRIPHGPRVEFGLLNLRGLIDQRRVAAAEFTGRVAGGDVAGAVTARWGGAVAVEGEFKLQRVDLQELARATRSSVAARGTLQGMGRFSMQAAEWNRLSANPQLEMNFAAARGELTNIDIVRAIQSPAVGALRGGRSAFEELTGTLQIANGHYIFRKLELKSGPLNAGGTIDVGPADQLSGRIAAELSGRGVRSTLVLGGTVQDPQLKR